MDLHRGAGITLHFRGEGEPAWAGIGEVKRRTLRSRQGWATWNKHEAHSHTGLGETQEAQAGLQEHQRPQQPEWLQPSVKQMAWLAGCIHGTPLGLLSNSNNNMRFGHCHFQTICSNGETAGQWERNPRSRIDPREVTREVLNAVTLTV